jgi:hypothetical protein
MKTDSRRWLCIRVAILFAPLAPAACAGVSSDGAADVSSPGASTSAKETGAAPLEVDSLAQHHRKPEVIVTGVAADSLVTDRSDIYWRSSGLGADGANFDVVVGKCSLGGGCPTRGTVLGTASADLVFVTGPEVVLAEGKVIVPVGGDLMACATSGCGGKLSTLASTSGIITSLTASGNKLFFGLTGFSDGSRSVDSCEVDHCATPHVLGVTSDAPGSAPGDPSVSGDMVAFLADALYVTPTQGFPAAGATLLAHLNGIGGGIWNDGTNVYVGVSGQFETDDAGDTSIQNGTGYVARCALTGCGQNPKVLASGESNVGAVVVAGTDVYWPVEGPFDPTSGLPTGPGIIQTCSTTDGCATVATIASGGNPSTITVDDSYVYWGDPIAQTITRLPRR